MDDLSFLLELPQSSSIDMSELNKDLERMTENVENISLQLTCMAYDMVALRTNPELEALMRKLEEAYYRCSAVICGDQEPEMDQCPDTTATNFPQM